MLRLLADRDHQVTANRTRTICRLHALLCLVIEGGTGRALTVDRAEHLLASIHMDGPVTRERIIAGRQLLDEIRVLDAARNELRTRTSEIVVASATSVTAIHGIGPLTAAIIIGRVGDINRFPTSGHFARHNGTAPIEASSGPKKRHRLNPRGDRQLNHAIHMAAVTQVGHDTPGRVLPPQTSRGQDPQRSDARTETAHQRRRLPTPHLIPRGLINDAIDRQPVNSDHIGRWAREDNARTSLNPAWPASHLT